jgi:gamma-glutamylcyclotransferase (GGCT)/AIG2-like uncharacterized protein YtfP
LCPWPSALRCAALPLLFSYGTLQHHAVQLAIFGRALDGRPDALAGFEPSQSVSRAREGAHDANASYTGNPAHRVTGTVFEVSNAELDAADVYEREADYVRVRVFLASGDQAWVYVHSEAAPRRH